MERFNRSQQNRSDYRSQTIETMTGVTIQINSLEALERLIGNDEELRVSLRNSVIQNFSKTYFKNIANEISESAIRRTMVEEFKKIYTKEVKVGYRTETHLSEDFKDQIRKVIRNELDDFVINEASSIHQQAVEKYEEIVSIYSGHLADKLTDESFQERLNKEVDKKIKSRLGIE